VAYNWLWYNKRLIIAMVKIFVDTNFWLIPERYKIDIFSEIDRLVTEKYEIFISDSVKEELEKIKRTGKLKDRTAASIGLELIKKKVCHIIHREENVDSLLLKLSEKDKEWIVCTNDKNLRKKLREKNIKVVGMRGMKKLSFL